VPKTLLDQKIVINVSKKFKYNYNEIVDWPPHGTSAYKRPPMTVNNMIIITFGTLAGVPLVTFYDRWA